ncbi:MAG: methyltransferase domain-containing protein [Gammaproteobacteria bacterium]|nr:methyltransferase domain-containing protein [Gammaproteobacteria bacterium]
MRRPPLTAVAQHAVAEVVGSGDRVVDATVGNGHDTLFLARQVAPDGRVIGFDVQPAALDATLTRLREAGLDGVATLLASGHEHLHDAVPAGWRGDVGAVMFNLGYLPGGDKTRITQAPTTLAALDQAAALLRAGGLLSLLVYRGHAGAADEAAAVASWVGDQAGRFETRRHDSPGPILYLLRKRA